MIIGFGVAIPAESIPYCPNPTGTRDLTDTVQANQERLRPTLIAWLRSRYAIFQGWLASRAAWVRSLYEGEKD